MNSLEPENMYRLKDRFFILGFEAEEDLTTFLSHGRRHWLWDMTEVGIRESLRAVKPDVKSSVEVIDSTLPFLLLSASVHHSYWQMNQVIYKILVEEHIWYLPASYTLHEHITKETFGK